MTIATVRITTVFSCLLAGALLTTEVTQADDVRTPERTTPSPAVQTDFGHLPLAFEKNIGQTAPTVQWLARTPESTLYLAGNDATVQITHIDKVKRKGMTLPRARSASVRMSLLNSQPARVSSGEELQPGAVNYLTGNDSAHWQKQVQIFRRVRLDQVYPGVSLLYHGERGQLEYDFVVAPNADPNRIALGFTGATPRLAANGDLLLPIPGDSTVRFDKPVVYQMENGKRIPVDSSYRLARNGHVSFHFGRYDHSRELIVDPTLVFLGTLGAGNYPYATNLGQMTVDSTGAMYFIGTTNDPTYPVTPGAYQKVCGPATGSNASNGGVYCGTYGATSAYVSKISADGTTLVYSTYLSGGGGYEQGTSIAVDASGVAYLLGATASNNFPITSDAFQKLCQPGQNPGFGNLAVPTSQCNNFGNGGGTEYTVNGPVFFYAKLSANGASLIYSSFLGGSSGATPVATALDSAGNWYLYGQTSVLDAANIYPTPGGSEAVQFPGVSSSGYQSVSTAVGYGSQSATNITYAAVLSKFSNDGHTLLYGTFLADETYGYNVFASSLAVGANGIVFIGGTTPAAHFPTTPGAVKAACTAVVAGGGGYSCTSEDAFVAAIDTTKSGQASLVYSTRLGGSAPTGYSPYSGSNTPNQQVLGLAANADNDVYVTGVTYDQTFPVPSSGYQNACNTFNSSNYLNCSTAFVVELNPAGTAILAGSFLAGPAAYYEASAGYKVTLDSYGRVYLYGTAQDGYNTFPLVNPVQGYSNNSEIYIATLSSDLTKLLFSTRIGNPSLNGGNELPVNGLALDRKNNIYFAGSTEDANFAATPGTYTTAVNSGTENHTFFGKISTLVQSVALGMQLDYQGEGETEYTVWRPSSGYWYSIDAKGHSLSTQWGAATDLPVVGDFDGDGKSDVAVWRPSTGYWYVIQSSNGEIASHQWGSATDIPVAGDFDGDGKTDLAVWRPSTGYWYIVQSSTGEVVAKQWGASTDIPVTGDFDGDGKTDLAVWRPSTGYWYIVQSSNGEVVSKQWGESTDVPVSGDFDGDGKTDLAVWRPSTGYWYIVQSSNGQVVAKQWGENGDVPVARDYDGDGRTDIAVFRPSTGSWYVIESSSGVVVSKQWGESSDLPVNSLKR